MKTFLRLWRHRWFDEADARRAVPPALAETLRRRVHASEQRHTGEVRICVEGGLPGSYLWRHVRQRVPMAEIVRQRALMQFAKLHVWDTAHNNGVLIYVLLAEHAIELVADRGVHARVDGSEWQAIVARLAQALHEDHFEDGLTRALEEVSAVLVAHFPADESADAAHNHLPDEPVLR
ncbi:MAG: TPM domain-containing protein [Pseudomonadota bacterium]|nr:TPM domain-containing protein [Pseudomonadota bacterium]